MALEVNSIFGNCEFPFVKTHDAQKESRYIKMKNVAKNSEMKTSIVNEEVRGSRDATVAKIDKRNEKFIRNKRNLNYNWRKDNSFQRVERFEPNSTNNVAREQNWRGENFKNGPKFVRGRSKSISQESIVSLNFLT